MTRYALVHEWLTPKATGGSELVVREILSFLEADLYALIDFESTNPDSYLYGREIGTTFLQHFPGARRGVQKYLPLLPLAIEQLDLRDYEVILSSSHAVAKGVLASPASVHICYCHTPMRYAWELTFDYLDGKAIAKGLLGFLTRYILHRLREWDTLSANRVDYFIANSNHTARRIWRCYRRRAVTIYPPVNVDRFSFNGQKEDFYLTVCRLVSYKRVALIVEAFNQLGLPLVLIGSGPELAAIRRLARENVRVLGYGSDRLVEDYMAKAKAFVYAACEDFGIALVEAQACGTPVIAYGEGGASETVIDYRDHPEAATGILFRPQTVMALIEAVRHFEDNPGAFESDRAWKQARRFAPEQFKSGYLDFLERAIAKEVLPQ